MNTYLLTWGTSTLPSFALEGKTKTSPGRQEICCFSIFFLMLGVFWGTCYFFLTSGWSKDVQTSVHHPMLIAHPLTKKVQVPGTETSPVLLSFHRRALKCCVSFQAYLTLTMPFHTMICSVSQNPRISWHLTRQNTFLFCEEVKHMYAWC